MIRACSVLALIAALLGTSSVTVSAQGIIAPGAGPINMSMAGASTAAATDFGASYWNPATLSGLDRDEALISSSLNFPSIHFSGTLPARAINGQVPPTTRTGTSRSNSGVPSGLAVGSSFRLRDDSPMTMGLGIFGLVGGGVNFAGSYTTPPLGPRQPPDYFGVGPVYANISLLAIKPMMSVQATDRLAVAFAPIITTGTVQFAPALFAPGPRDQFGIATFPNATNSRPFWGAGFQIGTLYEVNDNWNVGFSYSSPIWQERWTYNAANPDLSPRTISTQASLPAIYSWGVAYKGLPRTIIDVDFRYFDYANTALFGDSVASGGLNWNSVFATAVGAQYLATDRLTVRAGYLYNTNPINAVQTLFNIQAPGILQNTLTLGATLRLTDNILMSATWAHAFRNEITGPIAQIPGSSARLDAQLDSILVGLTIQYGAHRVKVPVDAGEAVSCPPETTTP